MLKLALVVHTLFTIKAQHQMTIAALVTDLVTTIVALIPAGLMDLMAVADLIVFKKLCHETITRGQTTQR
jgi:hypothetical protein